MLWFLPAKIAVQVTRGLLVVLNQRGRSERLISADKAQRQCMCVCEFIIAEVRLVGGTLANEGRLEMKLFGIWGTVCSEYFDAEEAKVACYMLNYGYMSKCVSGLL